MSWSKFKPPFDTHQNALQRFLESLMSEVASLVGKCEIKRRMLVVKAGINSLSQPKTVDPRKLNFKSRLPLKGQINCVVRCLSTGLKYFLLRVKCLVQLNSLKWLTTTTSLTLISCKHIKYCLGYVCLSSNHIISYFILNVNF